MKNDADDNENDDELIDFYDDDNADVIVPTSSATSSRAASAMNSASELKSMNDALNEAVRFVTEMEQKRVDADNGAATTRNAANKPSSSSGHTSTSTNNNNIYLNERRIENLIKKCKLNLTRAREAGGKHLVI